MTIRIGANPICWSNDDMVELGGDTTLETILSEAHQVGFEGLELGKKFPRTPDALKAALAPYDLACISGWHSAKLLTRDANAEFAAMGKHLALLKAMGSTVMVVCETSNTIQGEIETPLSRRPHLKGDEWKVFGARMTAVGDRLLTQGIRIVYHHHMGSVVQSDDDIHAFMAHTGPSIDLLLDTGHAAWGGAALASNRLRSALAGMERADSITIDAHKWFATTMGCAIFITRRGELLSEAFHASTSFMPSSISGVDPYLNSVQWSRRFLGLRLFLALAAAGWEGLAAHVERGVAVIDSVKERLAASGWRIVNDSPLAVLNAIPPAELGDVRALVRRVVASGRAWVAPATLEGQDVVRICATNGETAIKDVDALVGALNAKC